MVDIVSYVGMGAGLLTMTAGVAMAIHTARNLPFLKMMERVKISSYEKLNWNASEIIREASRKEMWDAGKAVKAAQKVGTVGKWLMGIGGALMIAFGVLKGVQMYMYYHVEFSQIPIMIVDEADIVTTVKGEDGKDVTLTNFDQFMYYDVVKCNRQEIGLSPSAQTNVDKYAEWNCGDAADINGDVGQEWVAMYVNRSPKKGSPILADSLVLKQGKDSEKTPADCNGFLHMFTINEAFKIDNDNYSYTDNDGMYLYWKGDENAFADGASATASAFNGGYFALAGIGGLALGILGTALVMSKSRKKKEETAE